MPLGARSDPGTATIAPPEGIRHPVLALLVIAAAELMVVLDATIVNIALPSIQGGLKMSADNLAWVVNAYAVTFGGLMLLGGRAGDLFGRRRVFRFGIVVFVLASVLGGLAPNSEVLICARVLQGVGAAVAAPTALALIATNFPEGKERNRAMGTYAAMAGVGSTVGLILGGVLTEYLDWRWVLLVNIPIGVGVLAGTTVLGEADRSDGELDVRGAAAGTAGLLCLVYAVMRGGQEGWADTMTLACFGTAAVLLVLFLLRQSRIEHPMLPLRVLKDRSRAGTYAVLFLVGLGMFATFYFLTLYMQHVLEYGAVRTGLAYLPFSAGIGMMAAIGSKLVVKLPPRLVAGPGLVVAAAGMLWLSRLTPHSSYPGTLMPAMFVTAAGLGCSFVPLTLGAVRGVDENDVGSASGLLNTAQQIGGALGLATLTVLSTSFADNHLPRADEAYFAGLRTHDANLVVQAQEAMAYGYSRAFLGGALVFATAAFIVAVVINTGGQETSSSPRD
ncbi:MFS transporter [Streptomyces sp. SID13666]|uniref:MFS transporter n=1 Tax=unclassified Streptomyces TaxID=2593676 RepID=UPI0013BF87AD|nr:MULTISPECIES: MFS transporter [unclassified Streptomyces]NEA55125.1 MFS transporter [Streptomyces sp. SID13666]NEA71132.1 MFS transporter [Streptomyces sp. SID13588]